MKMICRDCGYVDDAQYFAIGDEAQVVQDYMDGFITEDEMHEAINDIRTPRCYECESSDVEPFEE